MAEKKPVVQKIRAGGADLPFKPNPCIERAEVQIMVIYNQHLAASPPPDKVIQPPSLRTFIVGEV